MTRRGLNLDLSNFDSQRLSIDEGNVESVSLKRLPLMIEYRGDGDSRGMFGLKRDGSHVCLYVAKPLSGKKGVTWEYVNRFVGSNPVELFSAEDKRVGTLKIMPTSSSVKIQCLEGSFELTYKIF